MTARSEVTGGSDGGLFIAFQLFPVLPFGKYRPPLRQRKRLYDGEQQRL
jgi:hypothetical protein